MKYKKNMRRAKLRRLVLARYLFPLLAILLMIVSLYLPTLQYTTSESGTNDVISASTLIGNAWDSVRETLFGTSEQLQATLRFSKAVLGVLIVSVLLFVIGTAATLFASVGAIRALNKVEQSNNERALWFTLFPNRVALSLWQLPLLPLLAFPRLLVSLYRVMLANSSVSLSATLLEPITVGLLLLIATAVFSGMTAPKERAAQLDPFARKSVEKKEQEEDDENAENRAPEDRQASSGLRKMREEQLLALRQTLNQSNPSKDSANDENE